MKDDAKTYPVTMLMLMEVRGSNRAHAERRALEIATRQGMRVRLVSGHPAACNCDQAIRLEGEVARLRDERDGLREALHNQCVQTEHIGREVERLRRNARDIARVDATIARVGALQRRNEEHPDISVPGRTIALKIAAALKGDS